MIQSRALCVRRVPVNPRFMTNQKENTRKKVKIKSIEYQPTHPNYCTLTLSTIASTPDTHCRALNVRRVP